MTFKKREKEMKRQENDGRRRKGVRREKLPNAPPKSRKARRLTRRQTPNSSLNLTTDSKSRPDNGQPIR